MNRISTPVLPLVINGLPRSGTTMTERLFDSHENMLCFTDAFPMISIIASLRGIGGKEKIMQESFEDEKNTISEKSFNNLRVDLIRSILHVISQSSRISGGAQGASPAEDKKLYGMSPTKILEIVNVIYSHESISDLASLLQKIGEHVGVELAATKWTAQHQYAPVFLKNPAARWIEIVRNPYARFASERVIRSVPEDILILLKQMQDGLSFAATYKHERYKVIRYEDLCERTDETLADLSNWLGLKVSSIDLVNPLGEPFRPNSTENVVNKQDLFFHDSNKEARIGATDINNWRKRLTNINKAIINSQINFYNFYEKEDVPFSAHAQAEISLLKAALVSGMKGVIKKSMNRFGYTIGKRPPEYPI